MTPEPKKPTIIKRSVKHIFTGEERSQKSEELLKALGDRDAAEAEFDSVKASYKAKIESQESLVTCISAAMRAGFEMRLKECEVLFIPAEKKKQIVLMETREVIATEDMTSDDLQAELELAESAFDDRKEIVLWGDAMVKGPSNIGLLVVGKQRGRWFTALRLSVGTHHLEERLDAEKKSFKVRYDGVAFTAKRAKDWLKSNFKESAKGFEDGIDKAADAEPRT